MNGPVKTKWEDVGLITPFAGQTTTQIQGLLSTVWGGCGAILGYTFFVRYQAL